jgi:fructose-bisphosphate aldolase class II
MALVSMRELLDHAAANGYGIPAFNVNNLEQVQAVMEGGEGDRRARDPAGQRRGPQVRGRGLHQAPDPGRHRDAYPNIPLVMHQDHGQSPDICQGAIGLGFGSVMMDGSPGRRRQDPLQLSITTWK